MRATGQLLACLGKNAGVYRRQKCDLLALLLFVSVRLSVCLLAGCDYCPKLRSIGLKTAHRLVHAHRTLPGVCDAIERAGGAAGAGEDAQYRRQVRQSAVVSYV